MKELLVKRFLSVLFSLARDVGVLQGSFVTTSYPIGMVIIVALFLGNFVDRFVTTVLVVVDNIGSILFGLIRHPRVVEGGLVAANNSVVVLLRHSV